MMFKQLTDEEKVEYRKWARENYEPFGEIKGIWHPVVQQECVEMNRGNRPDLIELLDPPTCSVCLRAKEIHDSEYGAVDVPVTLDSEGRCAECAHASEPWAGARINLEGSS